jgi:hypothetical protein
MRAAKNNKQTTKSANQKVIVLAVISFFILIGLPILVLLSSRMSNFFGQAAGSAVVEAESGTRAGTVTEVADAAASGGKYIRLGNAGTTTPPAQGASLPISYSLSSLTGNVRYVATNGNDTSGTGSSSAPYATLSRAITAAVSGDSIVVRGGTYRQGNLSVTSSKTLKIIAYPGETPIFNGAQSITGGWAAEGSLSYVPYTPQPVTDGSGISFTTGQNLTGDGVGKFPDQAWIGTTQLRQVSAKTSLVNGTFWVDATNSRLYLTAVDAAKSGIEISQKDIFMSLQSPNSVLEGLIITRFSNTASDYGVINIGSTADGVRLEDVEISESAYSAIYMGNTSGFLANPMLKNITITTSNWMGIAAVYTDYLTLESVELTNMNKFGEFTFSPQSGALKTSRTWYTKVLNSDISGNNSHGLWFDQSNYDTIVANNSITNNNGSSVFFEISDKFLLINNYIRSTSSGQPVKLAGSSGLKLVNNTIIGGFDPIGIYTDNRSKPGCANPSQPLCTDSYGSDRDTLRTVPATLDWIPRLDLMINNIVAYPGVTGYCGTLTSMCITQSNAQALVPIETTIHKADAGRGLPQTYINGNVYANGTGNLINIASPLGRYTSTTAFATAMTGSPVTISGFEAAGKYGNAYVNTDGSPTSALSAIHNQADAVPADAVINTYIPAGTRHYGVTYK